MKKLLENNCIKMGMKKLLGNNCIKMGNGEITWK